MWGMMFIQIFISLLFLLMGWAIRFKNMHGLISGFSTRGEEEKKELIHNGYVEKSGALLIYTGIGMLLLLPLSFTSFDYAIEVQMGFMLVFLLGGMVYLSRYEAKSKRKRSYWVNSIITVAVLSFVIGLFIVGLQENKLTVSGQNFEISGMYGGEWQLDNIEEIKLLEQMPTVKSKTNGFGLAHLAKGHFNVEEYGKSLLFIKKDNPPYLYLKVEQQHIFINGETEDITRNWHEQLRDAADRSD